MPKKIIIADDQLQEIIALRKDRKSYSEIERQTGISRRTAQRAYLDWFAEQSMDELKKARVLVASEEYRRHLEQLVTFGDYLAKNIDIPSSQYEASSAQETLGKLWQMDFTQDEVTNALYGLSPRDMRQLTYQNDMLFKSLKDHTCQYISWKELEKWKESWNYYIKWLTKLREESLEIVNSIIKDRGLKGRIEQGSRKRDVPQQLSEGVLFLVWQGISTGMSIQEFTPLVKVRSTGDGISEVVFGTGELDLGLKFADEDLVEKVKDLCEQASKNLYVKPVIANLIVEANTMRSKKVYFEEKLAPIVLRPKLFRVTCDLCPV